MSQGNDNTPSEMNKSKQDKEKLSLMSGIALLIGSIIGSGIFISPRGVLLGTGQSIQMNSMRRSSSLF